MLEEYSIQELQDRFASGESTSLSFCQLLLDRMERIDRTGPTLRAVVEVNPDALGIAEQLDAERSRGIVRSSLHGIPILLKDSIDTADAMMTTGGSLAMVGNVADRDAFLVTRLREAGAVILGKTNMSEWGYMRSTRACSGWSSRGGQVRNPYALDRSPSGSSSGSAVAVAANLCVAAIGAEVDGSIVRPASINGVVGLKPTVGLISRSGMIGVAEPQDSAGPMARSVTDLATVLTFLTGEDARDPATKRNETRKPVDYRTFLDVRALKGARLGLARDLMGTHQDVDSVILDAVRVLRDLGAEIVDPANGAAVPLFGEAEMTLFCYELKASLNRYLAEHPRAPVRTLQELIQFNEDHADRTMPFFAQEFFELAQTKGGLGEAEYIQARAECQRLSRTEGIDKVMREHELDALIAPTDGFPAWTIDPVCGDRIQGGCSSPPAMAGYPHITVPAGYLHELPVALSFFSSPYREGRLLGYAYAFEQATGVRRVPDFRSTVET